MQAKANAKKTTDVFISSLRAIKNASKLGRGVGLDNIHAFKKSLFRKRCVSKKLSNRHYFYLVQKTMEKVFKNTWII